MQNNNILSKIEKYTGTKQLTFILFLIVLNFVLKLWYLDSYSFWLDETHQLFVSIQSLKEIFATSLSDPNAPLYSFVLHFWTELFGISRYSTNFLSTLIFVIAVVAFYLFSGKFFGYKTATFASLLLSLSNINLYYSHETRSYTLVILLTILSFLLFFESLIKYKSYKIVLLLFINVLLVFTHLSGLLIFAVQAFYLLYFLRKNFKEVALISITYIVSAFLLVVWILNNEWFGGHETVWLQKPNFQSVIDLFVTYFNDELMMYLSLLLLVMFIGFYVKEIIRQKNIKYRPEFLLLLLWAIFPIVVIYLVSIYYNPRFIPRYMLLATPGLYLLVAYIIERYKIKFGYKLLIFSVLLIVFTNSVNLKPVKPEYWDVAVEKYKQERNDSTLTIVSAYYQFPSFAYYFDNKIFSDYKNTISLLHEKNVYLLDNFDPTVFNFNKYTKIALFLSHDIIQSNGKFISDYFINRYAMEDYDENLNGLKYYMFRVTPSISDDTVFYGFENDLEGIKTAGAFSEYVYNLDEDIEFSVGLGRTCDDLIDKINTVFVTFYLKSLDNKNLKLVCSLKDSTEQYYWKAKDLKFNNDTNWRVYNFSFILPKIKHSTDNLNVYLWNCERGNYNVDDLKIIVK